MLTWDLRPGELWEHLGGAKRGDRHGEGWRGHSGILMPMQGNMLTANEAYGLVLLVLGVSGVSNVSLNHRISMEYMSVDAMHIPTHTGLCVRRQLQMENSGMAEKAVSEKAEGL